MLVDMAVEEEDQDSFDEAVSEADELEKKLEILEFRRMFAGQK